jgi:hypothetical protein
MGQSEWLRPSWIWVGFDEITFDEGGEPFKGVRPGVLPNLTNRPPITTRLVQGLTRPQGRH